MFPVDGGLSEAVFTLLDDMDEMLRRGGIVTATGSLGICSIFLDTALWAHIAIPSPKAFPAVAAAINGHGKK
jgi:hypothetical protein